MSAEVDQRADAGSVLEGDAAAPPVSAPAATGERRLEFLDALRGLAALLVVIQHGCDFLFPSFGLWSLEAFRIGEFGVFVFFLTSGFIIPVSIERYRSVGRFWIGRFFRLYPIYWAVVIAALFLHKFGPNPYVLSPDLLGHWVRNIGVNMTMVQELSGHPLILGQSWTLAYELIFYLAVSLLFVAGLNTKPTRFAVGLFASAVVLGTLVPQRMVTDGNWHRALFVTVVTLAVIGVAVYLSDRTVKSIALCCLFSVLIVPLVLNHQHYFWFDMLVFATMFTGTVYYRALAGKISWSRAGLVTAFGFAAILITHLTWFTVDYDPSTGGHTNWHAEVITWFAAYAAFGVGLLLRKREFPRVLRFLGEISYSLYLVHGVVIEVAPHVLDNPWATIVFWVFLSIAISALTHRLIERPFQALGRRVARAQFTRVAVSGS